MTNNEPQFEVCNIYKAECELCKDHTCTQEGTCAFCDMATQNIASKNYMVDSISINHIRKILLQTTPPELKDNIESFQHLEELDKIYEKNIRTAQAYRNVSHYKKDTNTTKADNPLEVLLKEPELN